MSDHHCFRVSIDEVAQDFHKFARLARTRTFEIYDDGKVEVLLVPLDAVRDWLGGLQVAFHAGLMTDDVRAALLETVAKLRDSQP